MREVAWTTAHLGEVPFAVARLVREVLEGRRSTARLVGGDHRVGSAPGGLRVRRRWRAPVVLIDGPSGSGKSSVARALLAALAVGGMRVEVGGPDLWYPGWRGQAAGGATAEVVLTGGFTPFDEGAALMTLGPSARRVAGHRIWDWHSSQAVGAALLDRRRPLVMEGCGVITPRTRMVADLCLWVDAAGGEAVRRERAIARDGEMFEPWWDMWAAQDRVHLARHRPDQLADLHILT